MYIELFRPFFGPFSSPLHPQFANYADFSSSQQLQLLNNLHNAIGREDESRVA